MKILGIETSCDETACAVVEDGVKVISNVVSSSSTLHSKTGGIIPEVASREQLKYMIPVLEEALILGEKAKKRISEKENKKNSPFSFSPFHSFASSIDAVAVTIGPGLIGSLLIGIETAKTISLLTNKPIIPVNHIFAHVYANWLDNKKVPKFPVVALIVSGGHTELFLIKSHTDWKWIGGTLDDAAGEAFDKTARLLGLGYPGGPEIAKMASSHAEFISASALSQTLKRVQGDIILPRPMIDTKDFNFSFSGLKTAVIREIGKTKQLNNDTISQFSYEIQEAITDVLVEKTIAAAKKYNVKSILLGGGVAANKRLSEKFKLSIARGELEISLHIPPASLCTDNAAVIASYAYFHHNPKPWQEIQTDPNLSVEVADF
ncbi:hypothetical protein A3D77_05425 [Candidatus Gottesmanbacteria bacterium RIFCSPHIGHO2_02_FULL_39_11]|uniref:tRNA N6-adenosine threonylcarbamoyltransferase n=1 Tax=Candidatus Gottesmanbacteria bacterium RIFCSPHIGHO2_02_FULL_39_11 TaxID=1798382 RepID=A0A1F5ZLD2_9BACT|nr:MAG: hypothetical protein A3D77_05425 [Candidatus Gottesmanbacteria bacterium RIFCSPHIGHO2_02_FULL_39_11]